MNTQHEKFLLEKNAELEKELAEKNRELEIETALEKVRVRAMAMHKSDELREVVAVVFEKLQVLNFSIDGAAFIITFIDGCLESPVPKAPE